MVYVSEKERTALLDAVDFIRTNADCADDFEPFEELCQSLMSLFHKAKKEAYKREVKRLVKNKLKQLQ